MALTTYAELQADIASWLMRDDLASAIPSFISLCEASLNRALRLRHMLKKIDLDIIDGIAILPDDLLEIRRLEADGEEVPFLPLGSIGTYSQAWRGSRMRWYSVVGEQLQFTESTGGPTSASLLYYARLPALSDAAPTNRVLLEAPDAYLYGALAASAPFLGDDQRIAIWDTMHTAAVTALQSQDKAAEYSGPLVIRSSDAW